MSERPTRQDLDEALAHAETLAEMVRDSFRTDESLLPSEMNLLTLFAEVQALREDYDLLHERIAAYDETHALLQRCKRQLATVEALPGKWRADVAALLEGSDAALVCEQYADELESALRGET